MIEATTLYAPGAYFKQSDSAYHLRTAHQLLTALQGLYPEIQEWNVSLT